MLDFLSLILYLVTVYFAIKGAKIFSMGGLIMINITIGVVIKGFYTKYFDKNEATLLAPWVIEPNSLPVSELMLIIVASILATYFLYNLFRTDGIKKYNLEDWFFVNWRNFTSGAIYAGGLSVIILVATVFAFGAYVFGGVANFSGVMSSRVSGEVQQLNLVFPLGDLAIVTSIYMYWRLCLVNKFTIGVKLFTYVAMMVCMGYLVFMGGRGNLLQYFISLIIIKNYTRVEGVSKYSVIALTLVVPVVILFGMANRESAQYGTNFYYALSDVIDSGFSAFMAPFSLIDHYALSKIYVSEFGFHYGSDLIQMPLKLIPRLIYPEKPLPLGIEFRKIFWGDDLGGIPPGIIGEGYIQFGLFGVFIYLTIILFVALRVGGVDLKSHSGVGLVPAYAAIVPYVAFNLVRGGLDVGFSRISVYVICVIFVGTIFNSLKNKKNE